MGGRITLGPNEAATVDALVSGQPAGATLTLIAHNLTIDGAAATQIDNAAAQVRIALTPGATHAYLRPEIRDAAGKILMIGNAIYVGPR
jgi:hypothetical protein